MQDNHDTQLSNEEEKGYRGWLSQIGQAPGMGGIDKSWTHKSYDLRGVYKKYGPVDIRKTKIPEEFKKQDTGMTNPDAENNWATKKGDSMDSRHDVSPWLSNDTGASSFDTGNDVPWAGKNG